MGLKLVFFSRLHLESYINRVLGGGLELVSQVVQLLQLGSPIDICMYMGKLEAIYA